MLTADEGRVLGCLVEKERATPQQYPLSEHAVQVACNQSTNRDPVMSCDTSTVRLALRSLREQGLARTVHRTGDRTEKHRHLLAEAFGLDAHSLAVLAVLLLRGPQTAGELRARTERMVSADGADVAAVEALLEQMAARPAGALVRRLERVPGQKEARWTDLVAERSIGASVAAADPEPVRGVRTPVQELAAEVAELRAEVAELRAEVAGLRG